MMSEKELFRILREKLAAKMQENYPEINPEISEWKGEEIFAFQEDLLVRAGGQISEKWFYTHMKSANPSLPRIDVLNLLSRYAGYKGWGDFSFRNSHANSHATESQRKANKIFIIVPAIVVGVLAVLYFVFRIYSVHQYHICFYDADTREPITENIIEVSLLIPGESPVSYLCGQDGCLSLKTDLTTVRMVITTPYYLTDTVLRVLDRYSRQEMIRLRPNNYALMIHFFSRMNVKDWQQRRDQLNKMISDSAVIYQVYSTGVGMELFTKWEFINKLTMPTTSLKKMEILDTKYLGDQIILLRFMQKE